MDVRDSRRAPLCSERPPASQRTSTLDGLLDNHAINEIVRHLDRLPSAPRTYFELTQAASRPDTNLPDIAKIVQRDPAMSAKVLQLVNSAYFGLAQRIASIPHAVSYLGIALIKGLALTTHVFATMSTHGSGFSLEKFQIHSVACGRLAKRLVRDPVSSEEALTAAVVHDIGKVVLAMAVPHELEAISRKARQYAIPAYQVERDTFGVTHAEVGAYLLGVWGLPFLIVESVAYHHEPRLAVEGPYDVLAAVHAADALLEAERDAEEGIDSPSGLDLEFLERAGLAADLPRWRAMAQGETRDAA